MGCTELHEVLEMYVGSLAPRMSGLRVLSIELEGNILTTSSPHTDDYGFTSIETLTESFTIDSNQYKDTTCTRQNILQKMDWLVSDAKGGDSLVLFCKCAHRRL